MIYPNFQAVKKEKPKATTRPKERLTESLLKSPVVSRMTTSKSRCMMEFRLKREDFPRLRITFDTSQVCWIV